MPRGPQLDLKWRRLSVSAKGKDAIEAIRLPIFIGLITYVATVSTVCVVMLMRAEWRAMEEIVRHWMR